MSKAKLDQKILTAKLASFAHKLRGYSTVAFFVLVVLLYGFLMFRISTLGNTSPSEDAIAKHVQTSQTLHIDQSVVKQLQSLQDNSVNVKSLFNEARSNPFQD